MNDELAKYRLEQAEKLFESLKGLKDLNRLRLPSMGITLKEWKEHCNKLYSEAIAFGSSDSFERDVMLVINDIESEVQKLVENRALEGHRIMVSILEELNKENAKLHELLAKDKDEREFLRSLISKLKTPAAEAEDAPTPDASDKENSPAKQEGSKKGGIFVPDDVDQYNK